MPSLRLFGPARDAAGVSRVDLPGDNVGEVLSAAEAIFGQDFADVVARSQIWVNGESTELSAPVGEGDEVAVLPPVSGG
jgi:sulfur-carrier protein